MSPEAHPPVHHEEPHSAEGGALTPGDTGIGMKPSESLGALGHLPRNFSLSDLTGAAELGGNNLSANDGERSRKEEGKYLIGWACGAWSRQWIAPQLGVL